MGLNVSDCFYYHCLRLKILARTLSTQCLVVVVTQEARKS
ncbi:hypothetical protein E2C01_068499 [Portunus trituberculatus]|uniref:Uncharacterized protein n=1 Tax=Portunus trituberculatus TaxID=210409 RepID=A0A5B7HNZ5_PORTR|nr:hypothetical protein [Portunus trituberculatus]